MTIEGMSSCKCTHIFIGPSGRLVETWLDANCDQRIRRYPPAQRGDLLNAPIAPGDCVLLVDGTLVQEPGPSHREILRLLSDGVRLIGAASTGALRAAELASFGMAGVGVIFDALIAGALRDDGELIVAMNPQNFAATTIPVVNLRRVLKVMGKQLKLAVGDLASLFDRAAAIPHFEREAERVRDEWASEGSEIIGMFECLVTAEACDVKALDAVYAVAKALQIPARTFFPLASDARLRVSDLYWPQPKN
jgi:hypothetical protein